MRPLCSLLPCTLRSTIIFPVGSKRIKSLSGESRRHYAQKEMTEEQAFQDIIRIRKLWNRAPTRHESRYPDDQKEFSLSRNTVHGCNFIREGLSIRTACPNLVFSQNTRLDLFNKTRACLSWMAMKAVLLGASEQLPQVDDIVVGGKQVLFTILKALKEERLSDLNGMMLGGAPILECHRKPLASLTQKQRKIFSITEDDLIGATGFLYNWNGFNAEIGELSRYIHSASLVPMDALGEPLDAPHFRYSLMLVAVLEKTKLLDMVRTMDVNRSPDRMIVRRMPPDYGFISPRYLIARIDMAHKVTQPLPLRLDEDAVLYDFHMYSF